MCGFFSSKVASETLVSRIGLADKLLRHEGCTNTVAFILVGWIGRQGTALALHAATDVLRTKDLPAVMTFLISRALTDTNDDVRGRMINAGIMIIDRHGKDNVSLLFPIFENYLNRKASDEEKYDLVREGVVIFTRALAKHLSQNTTTRENETLLAIGTAYVQGKDVAARGHVLLFSVENSTENSPAKVTEVYSKEMKGVISALASIQGYLLVASGPKVILHKWTGAEFNDVAFFYAPPLYVVSLNILESKRITVDFTC